MEQTHVVASVTLATLLGTSAFAMQPSVARLAFENVTASGAASLLPTAGGSDTAVTLILGNPRRDVALVVAFPACSTPATTEALLVADLEAAIESGERPRDARPVRAGAGWEACLRDRAKTGGRYRLAPQERRAVVLDVDFRSAGRHHVLLSAEILAPSSGDGMATNGGFALAARQPIGLFYEVRGTAERATFRHVSLEEIAARARRLPREEHDGIANEAYRDGVHPVDLDAYLTPRQVVPAVGYDPRHADLDQVRGGTYETVPEDPPVFQPADGSGSWHVAPGTPFTIKGRFSVKLNDEYGGLRPAWGWQIIAWWDNDGDWVELGRSIVTGDGSYRFTVSHEAYYGQNLKVQVRAWCPFFKIVNQDESLYRYNNPLRTNIGLTQDEGHRWVDAGALGIPSISVLFYRGYELYGDMYFRAKINPVREEPVRVYFPNTWAECGTGEPWSCADPDGRIWITADAAAGGTTLQHELGHQMNVEFWGGKMPADSAGPHNLFDCIPRGQALVEGYANFVPAWVQEDRDSAPTWLETPSSLYCNSPGNGNEIRVAATFWDMYDTDHDGADTIYFTKQGAVHSIFFKNGVPNDGDPWGIDDLRVPYRNQASAPHRTIIDDIFEQNGTN